MTWNDLSFFDLEFLFYHGLNSIDVEATLNHFDSKNLSENTRLMGRRLRSAMDYNRLLIQAETDWGEPRHFNALNDNLASTLSNSMSVIAKGDLNYRRFVQDRQ